MKFYLLTWHGTVICQTDHDGHWRHIDILEAAGSEGAFAPQAASSLTGGELGEDWLEQMHSFEFIFAGFALVTAIRADSGRGFYIKTASTYLAALDHGAALASDRSIPQTWETFLPLRRDKLLSLQRLRSQTWIEAGSRRRIPKEKIIIESGFWLKVGVRNLDLARVSVVSMDEPLRLNGNSAHDRFIIPTGPTSFETLVPETSVKDNPGSSKEILLHEVGNASYTNATGSDQLPLEGCALSEKWISERRFLQPPFFVSVADRDFFYRAAWNNRLPKIGESTTRVAIRAGEHKCVVLSRLSEGTVLDEEGIYKGIGFLRAAPTLPGNIKVERGQVSYREGSFEAIEDISGTVCVPINGNVQNYYHWMIDCLLSLEVMNSTVKASFSLLLPSNISAFSSIQYSSSLATCGFDHIPIVYSKSEIVRVERALWVECRDPFEDIPPGIIRGFQERVSASFATISSPRHRIFIERANLRGISNADEIATFLTDRGFTSYRLENMSFSEQVSLFANAEFVIAPHGAGLSNLLFSPKGTKVLELMPDIENRPFFWHLSSTLGHCYGQIACPIRPNTFNGRLHVDCARLKSLYELLENA